jgi:quinol monooxygenase YgiN
MYGYTVEVPAPIEAYHATHQAIMEIVDEDGGAEGLLLHLAYATDGGFTLTEVWESKEQLDAFNRDVFPKAMARAGVSMDGPEPQPVEFIPAGVVTSGPFMSDAVS